MEKSIEAATNLLRLIDIDYTPKRVVSLLCGSRSGSTIIKYALSLHPDLCSLVGEEEPYYKLARNGYPWHESDEFHECNSPDLVRQLIANELHNHEGPHNRSTIQRLGLEERPYVTYSHCRVTDTLLLKTPQNCYRQGVIQSMYPDLQVDYIRVTRNRYATINGLIDGWLSDEFEARPTPEGWWKFDMPPNWSWDLPLVERCINQYTQSQQFIDRHPPSVCVIAFEDFLVDWVGTCQMAWGSLGLSRYNPLSQTLPELSTTQTPDNDRWKVKRPWLADVV